MRRFKSTDRAGFALVIVLAATVLMAALIAGFFYAAVQEFRIGRNAVQGTSALSAAEYGPSAVFAAWDTSWNRTMRRGDIVTRVHSIGGGSTDTVRITRLSRYSFLLAAEGWSGGLQESQARRQVGMLARLANNKPRVLGALTSRAGARIENSTLNGNDSTLAGWDCWPRGPAVAGTADGSSGNTWNDGGGIWIGTPNKLETTAADSMANYSTFGNMNWDSLTARANIVYPPTPPRYYTSGVAPSYNADGTCRTTDPKNWGDSRRSSPAGACESYFPIIWAQGSLEVEVSSIGQGILLVEGSVRLENSSFNGLIINRNGRIDLENSRVNGAVMSFNSGTDASEIEAASRITYSSCILDQVFSRVSSPQPLAFTSRGWADLF